MRRLLAATATAMLMGSVVAPAAQAHPAWFSETTHGLPPIYTGSRDAITGTSEVPITRQSDNVEFIAHVPTHNASDMFFQRREGAQMFGGQLVDRLTDLVVLGGISDPGLVVYDITDPTDPITLATITCGGFHSEVIIWQNYLIQSWDGGGPACGEDSVHDPNALDRPAEDGVRIFDFTDPAQPILIKFIGEAEGVPEGVHNMTLNDEPGLLYLNMAELTVTDPIWGFVDLNEPDFPVTIKNMRDISPGAGDGCHDAAIAPTRQLFGCAAITISYIWDLSDPRNPVELAAIPNPAISIHHGARFTPDENYLVLNDELGGAAVAPGCGAHTTGNPLGALWFYDISVSELAPILQGSFSTSDFSVDPLYPCTSHFYGFTGNGLVTVGWYSAGMEVIDYTGPLEGFAVPTEHAFFEPEGSAFWSSYPFHGYVYSASHDYGLLGADDADPAVGLWIVKVEDIEDEDPALTDRGNVWSSWDRQITGDVPVAAPAPDPAPAPDTAPSSQPLPVTGGGLIIGLAGVAASALLRSRRED